MEEFGVESQTKFTPFNLRGKDDMKIKSALKPLAIAGGILLSPVVLAGGDGHYPPPVDVPEPSALALLGLGVAAMAIQRRRREKDVEK